MFWLFIIAILAWIAFWFAANTDHDRSPMVAWWSVIVAGLVLVLIAGNFAFMDGPFPILPLSWETADGTRKTVGVAAPVVLAYDAFALLGPIGNAFLWGFSGLWCFKKAFDGGWHRGALALRQLAVEDANKAAEDENKRKQDEQKSRVAREYRDAQCRLWFERIGATLGKWVGQLVRGRRS